MSRYGYDLSELVCPKCGADTHGGVEVLTYPEPGTWFRRYGRASCESCRITFPIDDGSPIQPAGLSANAGWFASTRSS